MTESIPSITVEVYRSTRPSPSQLASATVRLGPITIHDCRLLRNKSGVVWFALPSFSVQRTGSRQYEYKPTVELSPDLLQQISLEALRVYRAWCEQNETQTQTQTSGASSNVSQPSR